jgi:hypothetical protein
MRRLLPFLFLVYSVSASADHPAFDQPPHDYWQRPLTDRFTKLKTELEAGRLLLDGGGEEKAYLLNLLQALGVPASSQMLLFSTTSLQLRFITPANPRALFFNEDVYVGYIPGGRLEIVSIDPALGGIFYIFDIPRGNQPPRIERSNRCMNCHAAEETAGVPALVIKSVIPGTSGGSLEVFRKDMTGHGVPFAERFGGWYVTGAEPLGAHLGNVVGRYGPGGALEKLPLPPGQHFDYGRYLKATTDVLPQLLHEHQIGFVNRAIAATYQTRAILAKEILVPAVDDAELEKTARALTRYLLFADEARLPAPITGDAAFKTDFLQTRCEVGGASLKDFDLQTRLFRYRCSYMIYSAAFQGLPSAMKQRVYHRLGEALNPARSDAEYAYLPSAEKQAIRSILQGTLKDLPAGW